MFQCYLSTSFVKEIPGEPREQRLVKVRGTQIFIKDKMTEMVDILWRIFGKGGKSSK